ncbi:MiaB/RimO family radical SAM methylthiotransferase, partial [Candidatus Babeliales bacterium]|nr:MiaB/RimO family radical SAM methylthiotransferase [Candidatus Babeliales bacterium]
ISASLSDFVGVMRGCNNYCSYCIVPFTTGRERSFVMSKILERIKHDVEAGAKEVTLLGQNVDSYKCPETGVRFSTLLEKVGQIDGEFWVRFVSPHPKDMTMDVLDVMAANKEKLCSYIHLPLQSGSNKILDLMCRTYTIEKYLEQVAAIRERLPYAAISTDFIVGFPGETEEDYLATRRVMEEVRFNMIYSFIYSPRKYTKAAQMIDSCSHEIKQRRLAELQARHREIGTERNREFIGKTVRVLIEERVSREGLLATRSFSEGWLGRTAGNIRVRVSGDNLDVNKFVNVLIEKAGISQIEGSVLQDCKHSGDGVELKNMAA